MSKKVTVTFETKKDLDDEFFKRFFTTVVEIIIDNNAKNLEINVEEKNNRPKEKPDVESRYFKVRTVCDLYDFIKKLDKLGYDAKDAVLEAYFDDGEKRSCITPRIPRKIEKGELRFSTYGEDDDPLYQLNFKISTLNADGLDYKSKLKICVGYPGDAMKYGAVYEAKYNSRRDVITLHCK